MLSAEWFIKEKEYICMNENQIRNPANGQNN